MPGEARILRAKLSQEELTDLARDTFGDMVKLVIDVERDRATAGGMLHADGEQLPLDDGSKQSDVWGANFYPARGAGGRLDYTALINIRPDENPDQRILSAPLRERVRLAVERWIGEP